MQTETTDPRPFVLCDDLPRAPLITAEEIHNGRDVAAEELAHAPLEYIKLMVGLLTGHAQGEAFIMNDAVYAHWAGDAPTTEDRFMVLRTIEEELMHAREGWRLLREIEDLFENLNIRPYGGSGEAYSGLEGFTYETTEWSEHAALCALTDRVGVFQQEEQLDCSYVPYAKAVQSAFYTVEKGHAARGRYWIRKLSETDEGKQACQHAIDVWWPRALDMFGRSESTRQHRYIYYRLKKRTNAERREAYIDIVGAELREAGFIVPDSNVGRKFL